MRTIKFRGKVKKTRAENSIGKNPDDGTWVVGDLHYYNTGIPHIHYDMAHRISVDVETIGQHTGLHDMHGKEIYEGDVLMVEGIKTNRYSKVWWNPEKFTFYIGHAPLDAYLKKGDNLCEFCIAGNIYDTPELKEKLV